MIGEKEAAHGAALARLIQNAGSAVTIESWSTVSRSAYVVNDRVGLYMKYSTKRLSPWTFEFAPEHALELDGLRQVVDTVWLVLVCGPVGVVSENWDVVRDRTLATRDDGSFSLSISRRPGQKFRLSGARQKPLLVSESSFPGCLFD